MSDEAAELLGIVKEARLAAIALGGLGVGFLGLGFSGLLGRRWRWRRLQLGLGLGGLVLGALLLNGAASAMQCILGYGCPA